MSRPTRLSLTRLEDRTTPATLYTVTGTGDANTRDAVLTLREALLLQRGDLAPATLTADEAARVVSGAAGLTGDTIRFDPALAGQTITFTAGDTSAANRYGPTGFVVTTTLVIDGAAGTGAGVTLSGGAAVRLFAVTAAGDLSLANLTLTGGLAKGGNGVNGGGGAAGMGGAVFVDQGRLTVTASTLTGNQAVGGIGVSGGGNGGGGGGLQTGSTGGNGGGPNGGTAGGGGGAAGAAGGFGGGGGGGLSVTGSGTPGAGGAGGFGGGGGGGGTGVSRSSGSSDFTGESPPASPPPGSTTGGGTAGYGSDTGAVDPAAVAYSSPPFPPPPPPPPPPPTRTPPPPPPPPTYAAGGAGGFGGGGGSGSPSTPGLFGGTAYFSSGPGGSGAGLGGAVFNNAGVVSITNSTLTGNAATGGAGMMVSASGQGAGGAVFSRNGTLAVTASTLSANTATDGGPSTPPPTSRKLVGGGTDVYVLADAASGGGGDTANTGRATFTLANSILGQAANAVADLVVATNGTGAVATAIGASNLIRNTAAAGVGNMSTADPLLGPLADNGGPTRTMAPLPGSPAVDAAGPAGAAGLAADQRGAGFARVVNGGADVGAVEDQGTTTPALVMRSVPDAQQATAYAVPLVVSGPAGPYTFAVTAGALPPGLTLAATGASGRAALLSGTPTATGTFAFTVTATNPGGGTATRAYALTVQPPVVVGPVSLPAGHSGEAYAQAVTASGPAGPYTFAVTAGTLPSGLTLSPSGLLSGTPTAAMTATFTVSATSSTGWAGSRAYTLTIGAARLVVGPASLPDGVRGTAYSQRLTASGATGTYTFAVAAGTLPPGLTLSPSGLLSGTPSTAGTYAFTVTATSSTGLTGSRAYTLTVAGVQVVVGPASLPFGQVGGSYAQTLTASGAAGPFNYAVTAGVLPAGLTLSAAGTLSGIPTAAGRSTFTVTATSADGYTGSRAYTLDVYAFADTLTVTSLADDGTPGTLRYALQQANIDPRPVPVTIRFAVDGTIRLAGGELALTRTAGPVTIDATGRAVVVDAHQASRGLRVDAGVTAAVVGLTVKNGAADNGGGASNAGTLTLRGVTLTGNTASFRGGAAYNTGTLTVDESTLSGNAAPNDGGGAIDARGGTLTVTRSTLTGNTARYGGAVYANSPITVSASTFVGNTASYYGGAFNTSIYSTLTVTTSTFTGNTATVYGGAVSGEGVIRLTDSTVTGNAAQYGGGVSAANGVTLTGSIVSGNTLSGTGGTGPDVYSTITGGSGYNLLGRALAGTAAGAGNVFSDAPGLAPLADNGGPTRTMALLPGSPAVDAGSPGDASADQRGEAVRNGRRDVGAFEYVPPPVVTVITVGPPTLPAGVVGAAYSKALTADGATGAVTFAVTAGTLPAGLTLSPAGVLSGTPTASGRSVFTVTATTPAGSSGSRAFALDVSEAPPVRPALVLTAAPALGAGGTVTARFEAALDAAKLNLFPVAGSPADLTLAGPNGVVGGTLVVDADGKGFAFAPTGGPLPAGTYTLTLRSAADGFVGTTRGALDGDADGNPGGSSVTVFTVTNAASAVAPVLVSVPDMARGPSQAVDVPAAGSGLPVRVTPGVTPVTDLTVDFTYDPAVLSVTGAAAGPGAAAGATVTVDLSTPGVARLTYLAPTGVTGAARDLITLTAAVPTGATPGGTTILGLANLAVNGGAAVADVGVLVVGYPGDANGSGSYSGLDASLVARVAAGLDGGFAKYPLADPRILGDVTGDGRVTGLDAAVIARRAARLSNPLPALTAVVSPAAAAAPAVGLVAAPPGGVAVGVALSVPAVEVSPGVVAAEQPGSARAPFTPAAGVELSPLLPPADEPTDPDDSPAVPVAPGYPLPAAAPAVVAPETAFFAAPSGVSEYRNLTAAAAATEFDALAGFGGGVLID